MAGLLLAYLRGLLARWQQFFLIGIIAIQVFSGVLTGLLANGLWPLLSIFFAYAWERRRLPVGIILAAVIVFVPMNAAKHEFRERYGVQASEMTGQTVFRRADGFALAVQHTVQQMTVREMLAGEQRAPRAAGHLGGRRLPDTVSGAILGRVHLSGCSVAFHSASARTEQARDLVWSRIPPSIRVGGL